MTYDDPLQVDLRHLPDGAMRLTIDVPAESIFPRIVLSEGSAFLSHPTERRLKSLIYDLERDRDKRMPSDPVSWKGLAERAGYARDFEELHEAQQVARRRNWSLIAGRFDAAPAEAPETLSVGQVDQWIKALDLSAYQAEAMIAALTALVKQAVRDGMSIGRLADHLAQHAAQAAGIDTQAIKEDQHV